MDGPECGRTQEDEDEDEQQSEKKGYNKQGIYKVINTLLKRATSCVANYPQLHGLVLIGGQARGKWHIMHLGTEWRFVPRHIAVHVVQLVKNLLTSHLLGRAIDDLAGKKTCS